jgi:hypothetical protein
VRRIGEVRVLEPSGKRLCREVVRAALRFHGRELWRHLPHDRTIGLKVPGTEHPLAAAVLGSGGTAFGLALTRGPTAFADMRSLLEPGAVDDDQHEAVSHLVVTLAPYGEIPEHRRGLLARAGFEADPSSPAPLFLAKPPDRNPRELEPDEARIFLFALNGILAAAESGLLEPAADAPPSGILLLNVEGDPRSPDVTAEAALLTGGSTFDVPSLGAAPQALAGLPRVDEVWYAGFPILPATLADDDRTLRAVVVVEKESASVLTLQLVMGADLDEASRALFATFLGTAGALPSELVVSSRSLFDAVSPALAVHGVRCRYEPRIPLLTRILARLAEDLRKRRRE